MNGRRAVIGLCMLCALLVSAIAAQGAAAKGLTAVTCKSGTGNSGGQWSDAHCTKSSASGTFGHFTFTGTTHARLSNEKTNEGTTAAEPSFLKETIAATVLELKATGVVGTGTLKNEEVSGVMQASAESGTTGLTYSGVTVVKPEGKGCKVFEDTASKTKGTEGIVKTNPIKGHTSFVEGSGTHHVTIEPKEGTVFATFFIECTKGSGVPEALEGTWEITGSLTCPVNGATIVCTHADVTENGSTLKGKGAKAGLAGKATITAGEGTEAEGKATNPISVTTL